MTENQPIVALPKDFRRSEYMISGVRTVVYEAGSGQPLVFLHGSGTFTGFDFLEALTESHRVIIPYHPGFGESDDDRDIDDIHDYVLHYLELFEAMGLTQIDLIGFSFGGWIAAELATFQPQLFRKIVLAAPSGLPVFDPPSTDVMTIPAAELPAYLAHDPSVLAAKLPSQHDVDFLTLNYRERMATARVVWDCPSGNRKLARRLHRVSSPVLLLWGQEDRIRPVAHGQRWIELLPDAELEVLPEAGHLLFDEAPKAIDRINTFLG